MSLPTPSADTTCLVTGASSGIGAEIARCLARRGRGLTLVARREDRLRDLATELAEKHNVRAEVIAADLTDADSRGKLPSAVEELGLTVDVLVNDAGCSTWGPVHVNKREDELQMLRINIEALADLCSLFLPGMVERQRGAVLNVASTAAFQPLPGQSGYAATKAFVLAYSQGLQGELRGKGVTVTVLCPGPVDTGFGQHAGATDDETNNTLPRFMWVSVEAVAEAAVGGLEKGRHTVIPGFANAAVATIAHLSPRSVLVPAAARLHPANRRSSEDS
jgi:short-subunit dehydrogenase